ncbi:MAG: type VI secretion system membrane subunit TssM, partial [Bacteroidota bacterium]
MRGLINILKSRYFLLSVGMAMLVGLIFFLGRLMSWPFQWQLLGVIGVLVLFIVVLAISFARANKSASMIEQSIKQQGQQQLMNTRPDKRPEIEAMQEKLERAIQQLKTSKLGRGKRGKAALYALPWYMFIGPPAAGKTTTIANSGLNFPLGTDGVRGVGGTRDCDWFFTDSAILLDTAGRYTTEFQDNEEWVAFLETLKKHRKDQPINGVIIGISIADLISASPMEVEQHADTIRRRIDELIKHLGVRFPVYLTFTKCDLLQGFTEFFGDMQRGEREQVWGATLDKEQQADRNVRAVFETEFGRLHDALLNMRTSRLSRSLKREARRKVYTFPLQFGAVKDTLAQFVGQVFLPNPYQESPIFRGFYFTSGTQEGVPLDTVIQNIASQFNLSVLPESGGEPVVETKSYFIRQFFEEVVIPDQFLVERTSRAATQGRVLQLATLVGSLAILALFALGAFTSLFRGLDQLEEVAAASDVVQQARLDNPMALSANIANLDTLRQELYQLENPPLLSLGLYPSSEVEEAASEVYQSKLRALVAEQVERLERRMRQAAARGGNLEESARDTLFQDLKAYLLLTEEADRLSDRDNQNYLEQKLTELLTEQLRRGTEGDAPAQQATSFVEALQVRLENPELTWQAPFPGDDRLIGTARGAIGSLNPSVIYGQVIRDVKNELGLRDVTLDVILSGRPGRNLFTQSSARVDGVFQAAFWPDVRKAIRDRSSNPYGDDWVLGRENQEAQTNLLSEDEIVEDMEQRYFNDF